MIAHITMKSLERMLILTPAILRTPGIGEHQAEIQEALAEKIPSYALGLARQDRLPHSGRVDFWMIGPALYNRAALGRLFEGEDAYHRLLLAAQPLAVDGRRLRANWGKAYECFHDVLRMQPFERAKLEAAGQFLDQAFGAYSVGSNQVSQLIDSLGCRYARGYSG